MALPASGRISMGDINVEIGRSRSATISLKSAQNNVYVPIRQLASPRPSPDNTATISEWYGYQHTQPADTTAPTAPNFVSASSNDGSTIEIFWNGDTDNVGVTNFYVFRNNVYIGSSTVRSYYDYGVPNGTWFYQIQALDAAGNVSPISVESNYVTIGGGTGVGIQ